MIIGLHFIETLSSFSGLLDQKLDI